MMTREEVAEVITFCKKNDISYKARLAELGIPAWKFYDSKSRYALEQESSEAKGEFMQLYASGSSSPMPSFATHVGQEGKSQEGSIVIPNAQHRTAHSQRHDDAHSGRDVPGLYPKYNQGVQRSCLA